MRGLVEGVVAGGFDLFMAPLERWKLHRIRRALIPRASGEVLELGAGTGVNLRYYDRDTITSLTLSDRDERRRVLTERIGRLSSPLRERTRVDRVDAERLPFDDNSFDTVVATLLFCSVDCPPCGFDEIVRVLKPGGRYLFLEHVAPVRPGTARVFDWVNPVWTTVSRGCNLNRDTIGEMERSGFTFEGIHRDGDDGVFVWGVAYPPGKVGDL
ncbi:MAG: methyltransferase domain-containing protein [Alkalispirochaeta sp.]